MENMNDKEKVIIGKLLKIASNQQKIITRLAQQQQDPNIQYLKQAAQVTAANSGFNATSVTVTSSAGSTDPGQASTIQVQGGYTVTVGGAPQQNELREKFIRQLRNMVATQKPNQPELANLSVIFSG
jgi:hypothetical protein